MIGRVDIRPEDFPPAAVTFDQLHFPAGRQLEDRVDAPGYQLGKEALALHLAGSGGGLRNARRVGQLAAVVAPVEHGVFFGDERSPERMPFAVVPRRHAAAANVQDPSAIAGRDHDWPCDRVIVPPTLVPAVLKEFWIQSHQHRMRASFDGHQLADAHPKPDLIGRHLGELGWREHLIEHRARARLGAQRLDHCIVAAESLRQCKQAASARVG